MSNNLESAFIDTPPAGFAKWSTKTKLLVRNAVSEAGVSFSEVHLYGAYACVSKGIVNPSKDEILAAYVELPDEAIDQMEEYINRLTDRENAADVEVVSSPGKP